MSPTQRSLDYLRSLGHVPEVVEKWIPQARKRKDLFGCLDILSLSPDGEVVGVQTTSASNVSARVKKIADCEHLGAMRKCSIKIMVHGWRKSKGKWVLREVDCS